jgi:hypothetical protein
MWQVKKKIERPFRAVATVVAGAEANHWSTSRVDIFQGDKLIGGYDRNYAAFSEETFEPFELDGEWYALYAPDYTSTRLMRLPSCKDIGGEERSAGGFCPTEFYVPRYRQVVTAMANFDKPIEFREYETVADEMASAISSPASHKTTFGDWKSTAVGFVSGCIWGDDTTWKLEVIDLSRSADGVISRRARFGHLSLVPGPLVQTVNLHAGPSGELRATVFRQQDWDVGSGELIDPYE